MSKTNLLKALSAGAVLATLVYLVLRSHPSNPLRLGDSAQDFTLPAASDGSISLRDYRHRVVVLNFWATWCPPCVQETPSLGKFAEKMKVSGVVVIGVSVDQDGAALRKFVSDFHLSYPMARDPDQAVASRYGTFKFPETYILDRDGKVAEKIISAVDWEDPRMAGFVESLNGGK